MTTKRTQPAKKPSEPQFDDVLKRMLNSPPKQHKPQESDKKKPA
jgi:hypothetical protein